MYIEELKKLGINTDSFHWRARTEAVFKKGYKFLIELEKSYGLLDDDHNLVRKCSQEHCLNPLHYALEKKFDIKHKINKDEVDELVTLLDLKTLEEMGFEYYLESFNMGNPLPARAVDFFAACNYKLKKAHKPLLGAEVLDDDEI